ncbi:MAG: hypothetical protein V1846_05195 [Candidatus Komeilibacteria bacterium]
MPIKKRTSIMSEEETTEPMSSLPEFGSGMMTTRKKSFNWLPLIIIIIVIILAGGLYLWGANGRWWGQPSLKAVFLVNGQVYFGQIARETSRDLYLNNVYYVQMQDQVQPATTEGEASTTIQVPTLLKRGDELHQPYGAMQINRDQIVVIENVGTGSQVYQQIEALEKVKK